MRNLSRTDSARTIGGDSRNEVVRSLRGTVDVWDPNRRVPGCYTAYLDFEDGTVATAINSGYDHLDSREFVQRGFSVDPANHARARRELRAMIVAQFAQMTANCARRPTLIGRREPRARNATAARARGATHPGQHSHPWGGLWADR